MRISGSAKSVSIPCLLGDVLGDLSVDKVGESTILRITL